VSRRRLSAGVATWEGNMDIITLLIVIAIVGIIHNLWSISRFLKDLERRIYYIETISAEDLRKLLNLEEKDEG
jgi:hypothetical protein|tara:strand:+ start:613 stop:831 length:219 start_codon:yes stop_codon:yes gene_type:complete